MFDNMSTPEEWNIADKSEWVADQPLSGNAVMPALEGRDVVGFSESVDFSVKLSPQTKQDVAANPHLSTGTDVAGNRVVKNPNSGAWHIDRGKVRTRSRIGGSLRAFRAEKEREAQQTNKPSELPQQPQEPKPEPKPEKSSKQDESTNLADNYSLDQSDNESISRVQTLASTPATDPIFNGGKVAIRQIDEHYSNPSAHENALKNVSNANAKGKIFSAILENNFDLDKPIQIGKKKFVTPRQLFQEAGIDVDNPERMKKIQSLSQALNSHLNSNGTWSTSPTHSLIEELGFFEAEHIQHRVDMADPSTPIVDLRVKAFSTGADFEDSASWADMSPEEIDLVFHLLPTPATNSLKKSGSAGAFHDPFSPDGQSRNPPDLRGRLALYMWTKQGGRDGYSLSGMQRSPGEFQVEHIIDMSSGGKDTPSNFVMLLKRVNVPRSNNPLPEFVKSASDRAKEIEKNLANPDGVFLQTRLKALRQRGVHDTISKTLDVKADSATISSFSSPEFFKTLQRNSALLPDSLNPSPEDLNNFVEEINSIADPNTRISDLYWPQLEQFISAADKLGADPESIKEYIGRSVFNNYDDGNRTVKLNGAISLGRPGTNPTPASLLSLENRMLGRPKTVSPEEYRAGSALIAGAHNAIRAARNALIDRKGQDTSQFHEALGEALMTMCGLNDDSPDWIRNRKIRIERDLTKTIEGYIKLFPPNRPVRGNLASIYLSAAIDYYKITEDQFNNPELIKNGSMRKKVLKIKSTLDQIEGLQS